MARPLRIEYPNAVYHVTSRGNARADIFVDDSDRESFLRIAGKVVTRYNWLCHAYCLMDNHYHILIETPDGNLSEGMRQLNGIYTQAFNRRHDRVGHVFQGRFKAVIVEKESHLLELCRYVVLNPVRAGMVPTPQNWRWSSYRATGSVAKKEPLLTTEWIHGQFGQTKAEARKKYRQFVYDGINEQDAPWEKLTGQVILGSEKFIERVRELLGGKEEIQEIPRLQRHVGRPALEVLFQAGEHLTKNMRNPMIYGAHVRHGYALKEIAEFLGIHYTTVSKVIKAEAAKKMIFQDLTLRGMQDLTLRGM
jgi:putative transposase